jgi:menaquinol-cytochrome c reductase iron-sulfur subunit
VTQSQTESLAPDRVGSRRRFLVGAITGLSGLMALLVGVPSALYIFLGTARTGRRDSQWMDAGELTPLGTDSPQEVTFRHNRVDGWKIHSGMETAWVTKDPSGKLNAFSPWCTHLGCAYKWETTRSQFICPCHGSRFDKNGEVLYGPATRSLDRYEVKIAGNRIWLGPLLPPILP